MLLGSLDFSSSVRISCYDLWPESQFNLFNMTMFLVIVITVLFSGSVAAEARDPCQLSSPFKIQLSDDTVIFQGEELPIIIFEHKTITVDGRVLKLSVSQQYQAASFEERVRKVLILASGVSQKTGALAIHSMELISRILLQLDDEDHVLFMSPLKTLVSQAGQAITSESFDPAALNLEFGEVLATALKASLFFVIEETGAQIWSVFSDEDSTQDFESRIESIEGAFERLVESELRVIEVEANQLCYEMQQLETLDQAFKTVPGYPADGLIQQFENESLNDLNDYARLLRPGALESLLSF